MACKYITEKPCQTQAVARHNNKNIHVLKLTCTGQQEKMTGAQYNTTFASSSNNIHSFNELSNLAFSNCC